jgi:hypothetical protein
LVLLRAAELIKFPGSSHGPEVRFDHWAARLFLPLDACKPFLLQLSTTGLISVNTDARGSTLSLTPKGWERVDELQRHSPQGTAAFVAMWFDEKHRPAFDDGIGPALDACGYQGPYRVDQKEHEARYGSKDYNDKIDDRIIAEIRRASLVIVDITGGRKTVYFEAGFALGLGTPVIWTSKEDTFADDVCFDTQQFGHIQWKTPEDLRVKLVERIEARGLSKRL